MSDLRKELELLVVEWRAQKHKDQGWLNNCNLGPDWFTGKAEGRIEMMTRVLARVETILRLTAAAELTKMAAEDKL